MASHLNPMYETKEIKEQQRSRAADGGAGDEVVEPGGAVVRGSGANDADEGEEDDADLEQTVRRSQIGAIESDFSRGISRSETK